ncbi:hypothetical protein [Pseudolactococcus reticulitermitis]|uniref:Uncharacterized protein n=1 Tax=Pseudolactococcus reticulitermitis TaxID=2025039 RepID=A0A224XE72_9LACT|nr:hypothetical protein [Lactococcus reticulitermitis]GAX48202.1 hypothetical protein RsY01_1817 [Lactococcus reticulitermitis]
MDLQDFVLLNETGRVIDVFGQIAKVQVSTVEGIFTINGKCHEANLSVGDFVTVGQLIANNTYSVEKI